MGALHPTSLPPQKEFVVVSYAQIAVRTVQQDVLRECRDALARLDAEKKQATRPMRDPRHVTIELEFAGDFGEEKDPHMYVVRMLDWE